MARWNDDRSAVPPEVNRYDPALHGPGIPGVNRWKGDALAWFREHPDAFLPGPGERDQVWVLQTAIALKYGPGA